MSPTARLEAFFGASGALYERVDVVFAPSGTDPTRSEPLETGASIAARLGAVGVKSLLVKGDDGVFRILAVPARQELDSQLARQSLGLRKLRFARPEELAAITGIEPGGVPPFGRPLFEAELVADASLEFVCRVAFGGGHPTVRFALGGDDWRRLATPRWARLSTA